jgi:ligand-binding sensor domain-containing protein/signal transduction histidine kinase
MLKNRRALRIAWLWLCGLGCLFSAVAGAVESSGLPFVVDSWSNEEGLPQSSVISVIQTRDGYLWLGTLNGLVRSDGIHFTVFNQNNTPGLPSNIIVFLFEDSRGILWVGTETSGLCAIQNGLVKNFDTGGAGGKVTGAFEDESGVVWFSTADGRFLCWKNVRLDLHPSVFPAQLLYQVFHLRVPGKNGVVWRLQNGHVEKFRDDKLEKDFGASPWAGSLIVALNKAPDGNYIPIPFDASVTAACQDADGNLVVGTHGSGVYWFEASGGYRHISTNEGLSHGIVLSLCFDREGNLWVGTDGGGLDRVKKNYFSSPAGFSDGVARSVQQDAQGGFWVTFNSHGLAYSLTNSWQMFGVGKGSNAWSVLVDSQQRVWAGTSGEGLFRFNTSSFQPVSGAEKIGPDLFALFQGHDGKIWAGGENGLGCYDGQDWKIFNASDGFPPVAVRAIAETTNGSLWIGTEAGLFSLRDGTISAVSAPVSDISCLLVDRNDALWVGTSGHGLALFENGNWTRFSTTNGLASADIGYFIQDDSDHLWIGSYEGLLRLSFTNHPDGEKKILACRVFGKSDGLPAQECSAGAQPAALRTRDGQLWFPTIKGLVAVNPAALKPNLQPPPVVIESVRIDGAEQKTNLISSTWSQAVAIPPGNEQLEIHYTGLDFSAPKLVRFKYRMDGHETTWTDAGGERVARYPKLPPGNYRFQVIAENEDGVWNETGSVLAVSVQPYFWQTNWFRAVAIIFILAAVAAGVRLILTQKFRRQLRQQASLERERSRIARDLHDQLGANLTQVALLSEMAVADKNSPAAVEDSARQISETARETTRSLDEIVWAINPANDTLEGLANYACKYAQDYFALAGLRYRADLPSQLPATHIPPDVRHNTFLAFKEAVNNTVKHAHASEAWVRLQLSPEKFTLSIEDNGRGLNLDASAASARNGLKNMRERMADIRGEFSIAAGANGGTMVRLTVPIINHG